MMLRAVLAFILAATAFVTADISVVDVF